MSDVMTTAELAAELNRTEQWLLANRLRLEREQRFPKPVLPTPPYAWSRAQIAAWKDRSLPPQFRQAAAAYRAAEVTFADIMAGTGETSRVLADRAALDKEFGV